MYPITNKDSRDCKQTPLIEPDGFQVHAISLVQKELAGRGGSGIGLINTFSMELEASPQTGRIRRYSGMQPSRDHQAQGRATFAECSGNRVILSTVRAPPTRLTRLRLQSQQCRFAISPSASYAALTHVLYQAEIPGRCSFKNGPHVFLNKCRRKRNRHVLQLHLQLWILRSGQRPLDVLVGETRQL